MPMCSGIFFGKTSLSRSTFLVNEGCLLVRPASLHNTTYQQFRIPMADGEKPYVVFGYGSLIFKV
jgi:hypothetical protein